ncbi:MAG: hypothetical protein GVY28_03145 [Alphaproteobacteria bacterium]|jgi:hypothetical protein|nr:hypothetical protein [Alphaproteobacteria bacterium]
MKWQDGHVRVSHPRAGWTSSDPAEILVHVRLDRLKGSDRQAAGAAQRKRLYECAKFALDFEAAAELVRDMLDEVVIDRIVDDILRHEAVPIIVFPFPGFDDEDAVEADLVERDEPTNALPYAFANGLAEILGCDVSDDTIQKARVGRTKLNRWLRFLCQPAFTGSVDRHRPYILVDDVVTTGGTFAALRSHIVREGGSVICATALAQQKGRNLPFPIAPSTLGVLHSEFGEELSAYWLETFGHEISCLTEVEAQILVDMAQERRAGRDQPLQRLRDHINEAAAKGQ